MSKNEIQVDLDPKAMKISGYTKMPAGKFLQDIRIDGLVVFGGDFECDNLHASGMLRAKGNLLFHGNLNCDGAFIGKGNLLCEENASISGLVRVKDKIEVQKSLHIGGSFKSGSDVSVNGNASFDGAIKIKGNLEVGQNLTLSGRSIMKRNLKANSIKFTKPNKKFNLFRLKSKAFGNLYAEESLEIYNCIVRGDIYAKNIILGENTIVKGKITYSESISKASNVRISQSPVQKSFDQYKKPP
ncbi:MAG: hypothetical protein ACTSVZ_00205 [Promethearchaeota archaeon]